MEQRPERRSKISPALLSGFLAGSLIGSAAVLLLMQKSRFAPMFVQKQAGGSEKPRDLPQDAHQGRTM